MNRWQRRWVVIDSGWMLWNEKEIAVGDVTEPEERAKFHGAVQLIHIPAESIKMVTAGKTQRKFSFIVRNDNTSKTKDYLWRAEGREARARWIKDLKRHRQHAETAGN